MPDKPSPEQIENMLIKLPTKPGERFYEMMKNQSWNDTSQNTYYEPRRTQGPVLAYAVIAIGLLLFLSCGIAAGLYTRDYDYIGDQARERINGALRTNIPESASNVHFSENYFFLWSANARFDAPADDVQAWLDTDVTCRALRQLRDFVYTNSPFDDEWWQLAHAETTLQGSCNGANNIEYGIFIDQTDASMWIVYLSYFDD